MIAQLTREYISTSWLKTYQRLLSYFLFEGRPLTTKGRFLNGFVFFLLAIFKRLPVNSKVVKPVFIVGTGRSGTTLLGLLLSMHRDFIFLNEPKAIWHSVNNKDDVIGSYQNNEAKFKMTENDANDNLQKKLKAIYSCCTKLSFSKRVVDKYPEMIFRIPYLLKLFPDAKIIFLQRNITDTCSSTQQWNKDKGSGAETWWGWKGRKWNLLVDQLVKENSFLSHHTDEIKNMTDDFSKAAVEWLLAMEEGLNQQKKYPENILEVKYENILIDPIGTMETISKFCELSFDLRFNDYYLKAIKKNRQEKKQAVFKYPFLEEYANTVMRELGYSSTQP